ncbi:MAG: hypothetical protein JRH20_25800 [Deltaproteobacteria bacterium]|nr:hypothetical protein [Deltaproteobacteria bacterium]
MKTTAKAHLARNIRILTTVTAMAVGLELCASGVGANWATAGLLLLATLGIWSARVWGYLLLTLVAISLPSSGISAALSSASMVVIFGVLALTLPKLLHVDRLATLGLLSATLLGGIALGQVLETHHLDRSLEVTEQKSDQRQRVTGLRKLSLDVTQLLDRTERIRITFRNNGFTPLILDLPMDDLYAPLVAPLIKVEAEDLNGKKLQVIQRFGCGAVYSWTKVTSKILLPGQSASRTLWLAHRFYPSTAVLPRFSHALLMNEDELKAAPLPPPVKRMKLRVVYDDSTLLKSWRSRDLSSPITKLLSVGVPFRRIYAASARVDYVDNPPPEGRN